jgi:hypothetical protein
MKLLRCLFLFGLSAGLSSAAGFLDGLTPEQKKRFGLDQLTPAQQAELGAAIESYRRTGEVAESEKAAAKAVEEYKQQEEPGVVARAVELFKRKDEEAKQERITAVIPGKFDGWSGSTLFRLDNGQVWRQSRPGTYYFKARENVAVVLYKGPGSWRLRILDDEGAWIPVTRVQ